MYKILFLLFSLFYLNIGYSDTIYTPGNIRPFYCVKINGKDVKWCQSKSNVSIKYGNNFPDIFLIEQADYESDFGIPLLFPRGRDEDINFYSKCPFLNLSDSEVIYESCYNKPFKNINEIDSTATFKILKSYGKAILPGNGKIYFDWSYKIAKVFIGRYTGRVFRDYIYHVTYEGELINNNTQVKLLGYTIYEMVSGQLASFSPDFVRGVNEDSTYKFIQFPEPVIMDVSVYYDEDSI